MRTDLYLKEIIYQHLLPFLRRFSKLFRRMLLTKLQEYTMTANTRALALVLEVLVVLADMVDTRVEELVVKEDMVERPVVKEVMAEPPEEPEELGDMATEEALEAKEGMVERLAELEAKEHMVEQPEELEVLEATVVPVLVVLELVVMEVEVELEAKEGMVELLEELEAKEDMVELLEEPEDQEVIQALAVLELVDMAAEEELVELVVTVVHQEVRVVTEVGVVPVVREVPVVTKEVLRDTRTLSPVNKWTATLVILQLCLVSQSSRNA